MTSSTELVLVPVVIHDHGKAVTGLHKEQFVLNDEGKARPLAVFEEIRAAGPSLKPETQSEGDSPGKNEYANYVDGESPSAPVTIILLDLVNVPFESEIAFNVQAEIIRARKQIIRLLSSGLSSNGPTALLVLTPQGLREIHSFTQDPQVLIEALRKFNDQNETNTAGPATVPSAANTGKVSTGASGMEQSVNAEMGVISQALHAGDLALRNLKQRFTTLATMHAFEQIAHHYSGVPGRKTLLWISAGFPFRIPDTQMFDTLRNPMEASYERTWSALNSSNIAVYPVDIVGLRGPWEKPPSGLETPDPRDVRPTVQSSDIRRTYHESFRAFADATGGVSCVNNNDASQCFRRALADSEAYYMLGFYIPSADRKPGWHRIKLKVDAPHTELRVRNGYFVAGEAAGTKESLKEALDVALSSPVDYTDLRITVQITGIDLDRDPRRIHFVINMLPHSFTIDPERNNFSEIEVSAFALKEHGERVAYWSKTLRGFLKPATASALLAKGLAHRDELEVAPGKYTLKFVIRDVVSGKMGSITVPVDVD